MARNITLKTVLNQASKEAESLPYFNMLPTDKVGILKWRVYVMTRCLTDSEFRHDIEDMCKADIAFFAVSFCWAHETRDDAFTTEAGKFPYIPWKDQVDVLAWFQKYGGRSDITVEKTRGIGLSWVVMIFLLWKWLFHGEHLDYGIVSKDETSLDIPNRPATLMGKLDILFKNLPGWWQLGPDSKSVLHRTHGNHRFVHKITNNAILGFTSTDDKLRSTRVNLLIVDEAAFLPVDTQRWLASSQFITSSRIFISTHDGTATMFYRMTIDEKARLVRVSTWWQDNPVRWKGAYIVKGGVVHYVDKSYKHEPNYEFHFENPGLLRSPWVDGEFEKPGADPVSLLQEIYGTAAIDTKRLIQPQVTEIAARTCSPPVYRCILDTNGEFVEDIEGDWYFWQDIYLPFTGTYYIGVDPSIGVADRALAGVAAIDVRTGAVIVTAALREMNSVGLARAVNILCKLLAGPRGSGYAQVAPESTGIGVSFLTELRRLRWPSIYMEGKKYGIHNRDRGEKVLVELGRAIQDGDIQITDARMVDDIEHFEYNSKGDLVFTGGVGHGDLGQAGALAWWAGRTRRRAIIDAERPKEIETRGRQPIEMEAYFRASKNRTRNWSNRFSIHH